MVLLLLSCTLVADKLGTPKAPGDATEHVFTVPKGATARTLGTSLESEGIVDDAAHFRLYVRLKGEGGCIKAGRFRLRADMSAAQILSTLCGPPMPEDVPFTVVEGWRIREIDEALAAAGLAPAGAYIAATGDASKYTAPFPLPSGSLEGYLFPETYNVTPDRFVVDAFVQRQLDKLAERFYLPHKAEVDAGRGMRDLVIMASMLEREEPTPSQRGVVAGILWKRLDHGWKLGVDATSRYTLEEWNDRVAFLDRLRDPNDPYNTRLRDGLPPTPIGNPSLPSLEAALAPVESEYWYYLHDAAKILHPGRNAAEHEALRRKYSVY
jgi:UPF0755 protein